MDPDRTALYPIQRGRASTVSSDRSSGGSSLARRQSNWTPNGVIQESPSISRAADNLVKHIQIEGFRQFVAAQGVFVKALWLVLFSLSLVVLIYELCKGVRDYRESPVTTTFTVRTPQALDFPQVYICNANPMNRSYLIRHLDALKGVKSIYESVVDAKKRKKRDLDGSDTENHQEIDLITDIDLFDQYRFSTDTIDPRLKSTHAQVNSVLYKSYFLSDDIEDLILEYKHHQRHKRENSKDTQTAAAYNFLMEAGFNIKETFLSCHFDMAEDRTFDCEDIIQPILDPNYFLCYVVRVPEDVKQRRGGKGLRLLINSHISLYPTQNETDPNKNAGIFVSVSKNFDPTNWLKSTVAPGTTTKIDISAKNVKLMNLESGPLIQPCVADGKKVYRVFNTTYSRTACQMDCMLDAFYRYCQCILLVDESLIREDILETSTFCSFNKTTSCLIPKVTKSKQALSEIDQCRKVCHTPCDDWRYDMRSSRAKLYSLQNRLWRIDDPLIPLSDVIDLRIAYNRLEYDELVQSPSKTLSQLISDFGGQLNLWLGASLISLIHATAMVIGFVLFGIYTRFCE